MTGKEFVEVWQTRELIKDLRRRGTKNGTALEIHLGACDSAADCIECLESCVEGLLAEVERLGNLLNWAILTKAARDTKDEGT